MTHDDDLEYYLLLASAPGRYCWLVDEDQGEERKHHEESAY